MSFFDQYSVFSGQKWNLASNTKLVPCEANPVERNLKPLLRQSYTGFYFSMSPIFYTEVVGRTNLISLQ